MRVLHIITSLHMGGAERLMVDLLPRLSSYGIEVCLFVLDGMETPFMRELRALGVEIVVSPMGFSVYNPLHIWPMRRLMKRYDLIHTHNFSPQLFGAIASIGMDSVLCTTEHSTSNRRRSLRYYKPIDKWMYRQYSRVVCISDPTEESLASYLGASATKVRTIYNGVGIDRYLQATPAEDLCDRFGQAKLVCMVAGFRIQKDQKTLIRAMRSLPIDYQLILVGEGALQSECQIYTHELGLEERVHFLGIRTDIPSVFKASSVSVISSHWEGFGLVAVEAMAAGLPVIASDVPGLAGVVEGAGVLFPQGNDEMLATEIRRACEDPSWRSNLIAMGQKRAKRYDISAMVENYIKLYQELL